MTDNTPRNCADAEERDLEPPEPRLLAIVCLLSVGALTMALPESLTVGPRWLLLAIVSVLLIPMHWTHRKGRYAVNHFLGQLAAAVVSFFLIFSLILLIRALPAHTESPMDLLISAACLWITNVLVFASWYWRLDAGGPNVRDLRGAHCSGAFLFPQMTLDPDMAEQGAGSAWSPQFVDYLFLAFNTSTALSPTDAAVLSRWAKALVMAQASISLVIIVILAARAINIL